MSESKWQPIESAPEGVEVIRYEPATYSRHGQLSNRARIVISDGNYPRKATHWMPLPSPPDGHPMSERMSALTPRSVCERDSQSKGPTAMSDDLPVSVAEAEMDVCGRKIKVHVLSDGRRVIEKEDMERFMRDFLNARFDDDESEICEFCEKKLFRGDLVHRCADGPVLCEECSPTFNDIRREYDKAKADGTFERMFPFPEDAEENDKDLREVIAAGHGDKKNVSPL